jgi:NADPH:quinone reductase-like Zn-dependent oxidoreductase
VIATARPGRESELVLDLGAAHTIDYTGDVAAQVREISPSGVPVVLHFAGDGAALTDLLSPGGRIASTHGLGPDALARDDATATPVAATPDRSVLDRLAEEVVAGRLRMPITRIYSLQEVPQALADFEAGSLGKLAVSVV